MLQVWQEGPLYTRLLSEESRRNVAFQQNESEEEWDFQASYFIEESSSNKE